MPSSYAASIRRAGRGCHGGRAARGAQSLSGHASDEVLHSMIENGERKRPSLPVFEALRQGLGVPMTALLESEEEFPCPNFRVIRLPHSHSPPKT